MLSVQNHMGRKNAQKAKTPPKYTTRNGQHPTFSYRYKARPTPEKTKPELVVI